MGLVEWPCGSCGRVSRSGVGDVFCGKGVTKGVGIGRGVGGIEEKDVFQEGVCGKGRRLEEVAEAETIERGSGDDETSEERKVGFGEGRQKEPSIRLHVGRHRCGHHIGCFRSSSAELWTLLHLFQDSGWEARSSLHRVRVR
jgi:hypothetical protein